MTVIIIILAYIANIFLNRWLNKKLLQIDRFTSINPVIWFIPIVPIFSYIVLILDSMEWGDNWFTGKYWK